MGKGRERGGGEEGREESPMRKKSYEGGDLCGEIVNLKIII